MRNRERRSAIEFKVYNVKMCYTIRDNLCKNRIARILSSSSSHYLLHLKITTTMISLKKNNPNLIKSRFWSYSYLIMTITPCPHLISCEELHFVFSLSFCTFTFFILKFICIYILTIPIYS